MSEPENHTLRVLVEFRNEFREFKAEIVRELVELKTVVANLTQSLAGEMAANRGRVLSALLRGRAAGEFSERGAELMRCAMRARPGDDGRETR